MPQSRILITGPNSICKQWLFKKLVYTDNDIGSVIYLPNIYEADKRVKVTKDMSFDDENIYHSPLVWRYFGEANAAIICLDYANLGSLTRIVRKVRSYFLCKPLLLFIYAPIYSVNDSSRIFTHDQLRTIQIFNVKRVSVFRRIDQDGEVRLAQEFIKYALTGDPIDTVYVHAAHNPER